MKNKTEALGHLVMHCGTQQAVVSAAELQGTVMAYLPANSNLQAAIQGAGPNGYVCAYWDKKGPNGVLTFDVPHKVTFRGHVYAKPNTFLRGGVGQCHSNHFDSKEDAYGWLRAMVEQGNVDARRCEVTAHFNYKGKTVPHLP
jgi:hypothetical protein